MIIEASESVCDHINQLLVGTKKPWWMDTIHEHEHLLEKRWYGIFSQANLTRNSNGLEIDLPASVFEEAILVIQITAISCPRYNRGEGFYIMVRHGSIELDIISGIPDSISVQYVNERQPANDFSEVAVGLTPQQLLSNSMRTPYWSS